MKKKLLLALTVISCGFAHAQYTTPNTNVTWSLEDLAAAAPQTLSLENGVYVLSEDLIIAPTDKIQIDNAVTLHIAAGVEIQIEGTFRIDSDDEVTITAVDNTTPYKGFRFQNNSVGYLRNAVITYGGGIRVLTSDFEMDHCTVSHHNVGSSTGSALAFSMGTPVVKNSTISFNEMPAFSSGANQVVSATFLNNHIEGNTQGNSNRPQINMGPGGEDTIRIVGNTIIGDPALPMVGGISVSALLGGENRFIIDENTITNNRYGITIAGATSSGYIRKNVIEDNNTQNNPAQGGSGISLSANGTAAVMNVIVSENEIRRNLWGITVINQARINLGSDESESFNIGKNIFSENGNNNKVYALYNNSAHPIEALHNCWIEGEELTDDSVEDVIFHQADDETLGLVNYTPFGCDNGSTAAVNELEAAKINFYPNPNSGQFTLYSSEEAQLEIYNTIGQKVHEQVVHAGENAMNVALPSGIFFAVIKGQLLQSGQKIMIQ